MPDFTQLSLAVNCGLFAGAGAAVWAAGTRISSYADGIATLTGLGQAVIGLLLLAGVTSLPEIGVTVPAAYSGNADLAVNNLIGSIAMQVAMLAVVDFAIGRRALTSALPEPALLLLLALNVLLLSLVAAGAVIGDVPVLGIGAWSWACLGGYVISVWMLTQAEGRRPWLAGPHRSAGTAGPAREEKAGAADGDERETGDSLRALILKTVAAAAILLVAGYVLARTGEAIAQQTGIGSSLVGFALIAVSTSLPELSAALAAARLGLLTMAISDILGTNMINVGLVFVVDAVAAGEPVLDAVGSFTVIGALLSIVLTTLFLAGLTERRDRTLGRLGLDSIAVVLVYAGGLFVLYAHRGG